MELLSLINADDDVATAVHVYTPSFVTLRGSKFTLVSVAASVMETSSIPGPVTVRFTSTSSGVSTPVLLSVITHVRVNLVPAYSESVRLCLKVILDGAGTVRELEQSFFTSMTNYACVFTHSEQ